MPKVPTNYIFAMKFARVYPLYVQKAERKNRTKEEVDQILCWLTGYDQAGLEDQIRKTILKPFLLKHHAFIPIARLSKASCAAFA